MPPPRGIWVYFANGGALGISQFRASTAAARSDFEANVTRTSMLGFAARLGMDVLPMCSIVRYGAGGVDVVKIL